MHYKLQELYIITLIISFSVVLTVSKITYVNTDKENSTHNTTKNYDVKTEDISESNYNINVNILKAFGEYLLMLLGILLISGAFYWIGVKLRILWKKWPIRHLWLRRRLVSDIGQEMLLPKISRIGSDTIYISEILRNRRNRNEDEQWNCTNFSDLSVYRDENYSNEFIEPSVNIHRDRARHVQLIPKSNSLPERLTRYLPGASSSQSDRSDSEKIRKTKSMPEYIKDMSSRTIQKPTRSLLGYSNSRSNSPDFSVKVLKVTAEVHAEDEDN
ncbi:uncharacterized protein [Linepithema humile]|uniref:uncharacterized protein isoform X1 n=1 Tax=Linepithema humile TaxID=83485 RepID=UPI00351F6789